MMDKCLPIALASDHGGFQLKEQLKEYLTAQGYVVEDYGTNSSESCDYPDFAIPACQSVVNEKNRFAILCCGTGIGMSICANKIRGIRAAVCTEAFSCEYTRRHNDANVLCLGQRVISYELARDLVELFLSTEFEGGRHSRRLEKIFALEKR